MIRRILIPGAVVPVLATVAWFAAQTIAQGGEAPGLTAHLAPVRVPKVKAPGYLESVVDPVSGVRITRITNNRGRIPGFPEEKWKTDHWGSRPAYSTKQAWSADGKLIYLETAGLLIDGTTHRVLRVGRLPEGHWSPVEPDILWAVSGSSLIRHNARTDKVEAETRIRGYSGLAIDVRSSPSRDGKYLAVVARRESDRAKVAMVLDLARMAKAGVDITAKASGGLTDRYVADMTPSGRYLRTAFTGRNNSSKWWDYRTGRKVSEVKLDGDEHPGHGDHAVDLRGDDVLVGVDKDGEYGGGLMAFRVKDGVGVHIHEWSASHTSGRNTRRPGWVFSSNIGGEIFAVRLDGRRVERICFTYSRGKDSYWDQPQAIPSPDGRKVLFTSDWDDQLSNPQSFVADFGDRLRDD